MFLLIVKDENAPASLRAFESASKKLAEIPHIRNLMLNNKVFKFRSTAPGVVDGYGFITQNGLAQWRVNICRNRGNHASNFGMTLDTPVMT